MGLLSLGIIFPLMAIIFDLVSGILIHIGLDKIITSHTSLKMLKEEEKLNQLKTENAVLRDTIGYKPEAKMLRLVQQLEKDGIKDRKRQERQARCLKEWR